jgi:hypothetical protein
MSVENTSPKKSLNGRWRKGKSGNPDGRPVGSRNKSTAFFEKLLDGQGEALIQKAIELSLKGDTRALSICWDRLLPPRKERTIVFSLPAVSEAQNVSAALASVVRGVAEGHITPGEAESLARVLETQKRVVELEALAERVAQLEKAESPTTQSNEPSEESSLAWVTRNYSKSLQDSGETGVAHQDQERRQNGGSAEEDHPQLNSQNRS